ncbi:ComF family protein [Shewanella sp. D64]|nr:MULTISPECIES: ComF family protein [unclassified Shewanella]MEC4727971.1 ComF family protein [Shewanella sp. D64]MEC4740057.1 ComF family protein [Shewanella sp. E94]WBJ95827.1 ComF family protein [Shewanella sp. MTB7]
MKLMQWLSASLPNRCLMCHQSVSLPSRGLCVVCLNSGLYQQPICQGCGCTMQLQAKFCGQCMKTLPLSIIAPCSYHQGLGEWIGLMKYQGQFAALPVLSQALVNRILELESLGMLQLPQVLVPVPLHPNRQRKRGFNQAWLIADAIHQQLHIPVVAQGVERILDTKSQAGLTGKQRRQNLSAAFTLTDDFLYQRIALIDDVVTTGTTVKEIAIMFEQRHIHVQVWCLARAEAPGLLD